MMKIIGGSDMEELREYIAPEMEIIPVNDEDVIVTSGYGGNAFGESSDKETGFVDRDDFWGW